MTIKKKNDLKLAYFLAVLNAAVIGMSFLLVKLTLDFADPLDTLTYRFAAAFVIMIFPAAFGFVKLKYSGKPLYPLLLLASLYPIGYFMLQTFGLQHATSAEGGIISAFTPVVTMVFASVFLKETTTPLQKFSLVLSAVGVSFIFIMKGSSIDLSQITGIVLLLLACTILAGYNVLARAVTQRFSSAEISYFMMGTAFISLLVLSLTTHSISGTVDDFVAPLANGAFVALILCLGAVQFATALMANYILSKMQASKMSVFAHLSTIVSIASGSLFLQEAITWYHLCGSVLIISGVIGANLPVNHFKSVLNPKRSSSIF